MITRCTACRTWFQVAPDSLQAVHGLVRCGHCGTVFNALATLRAEPPAGEPGETGAPAPEGAEPGEEVPEPPALRTAGPQMPGAVRWAWRAAAAVLVLALSAQLLQADRRAAAGWPVLGAAVRAAYRIAGHPLAQAPILARYRLADTALVGEDRAGTPLELHGTLVNGAARAQPLPLIDLRLTDRFGAVVASRLLGPGDYGAGDRASLASRTGLALKVKLADPGLRAVGFTLALCKRVGGKVRCQRS